MDVGFLLLRTVVGLTLAAHGAQKLFGWFGGYGLQGTGQWMESIGFHPGRRYASLAALGEVGGGLLLALGLLTPVAAALVIAVMIVAVVTVHLSHGFFAGNGGYEYNLVLSAAAATLAFTGPGAFSVDGLLGYPTGSVAWGIGVLIAGLLGAAGALSQRRVGVTEHAAKAA
jgi:putative oxidoreductase